jgi:ent-kaurene synthase
MVPAKGAPQAPHFPLFVEWILQNQHNDGSWGLGHLDPCSLGKDAVSSTLSCILALKTWNMGDEHIRKGMNIESTHVNTKFISSYSYDLVNRLFGLSWFSAISGLYFIEKNSSYIMDEKCSTPLGFNIIFPSMIRFGINLGLELPLKQSDIDEIFRLQEIELRERFATAHMQILMPTACIF